MTPDDYAAMTPIGEFQERKIARWPGRAFVVGDGAKVGAWFKRVGKQIGREEVSAREAAYFADRDPWLVEQLHPWEIFTQRHNQYATRAPQPEDETADRYRGTRTRAGAVAELEQTLSIMRAGKTERERWEDSKARRAVFAAALASRRAEIDAEFGEGV